MAKTSQKIRQQRPAKYRVRAYHRCKLCGRPRGYMRKFGMCRICFRNLAHRGEVPGVTKASW
ncbi:MAG: type Z 30S ribosomal protein S14 [Bacillota bacterium]